jgi:hypothetical protein
MNRQLQPTTSEEFMDGIFIRAALLRAGQQIFMHWLDSDCCPVSARNAAAGASR